MSSLSDGTKVWWVEVWGGETHHLERSGELVTVGNAAMVRLAHGTIVKQDGRFHASMADAKRAAADQLDAIRDEIGEKARALRIEASLLDAKEGKA